jgi:hypothetical protein
MTGSINVPMGEPAEIYELMRVIQRRRLLCEVYFRMRRVATKVMTCS